MRMCCDTFLVVDIMGLDEGLFLIQCQAIDHTSDSSSIGISTILTISGGRIRNHQFVPWAGYKPVFRQWTINESNNIKSKLDQKLYDETYDV